MMPKSRIPKPEDTKLKSQPSASAPDVPALLAPRPRPCRVCKNPTHKKCSRCEDAYYCTQAHLATVSRSHSNCGRFDVPPLTRTLIPRTGPIISRNVINVNTLQNHNRSPQKRPRPTSSPSTQFSSLWTKTSPAWSRSSTSSAKMKMTTLLGTNATWILGSHCPTSSFEATRLEGWGKTGQIFPTLYRSLLTTILE
jgi:hypothetical protein